ncbi:hypothetical protein VPNG_09254 [Cytospora leucostoma]|uniref:Uncharacterized protein n=1 Tax=Cytospora leucostoma TaxID=1230097 RepID=A0A423W0M1_9PEZI|nr:hypothetical protein VPNG_09254 [Cytospora leucostoma]
MALLTDQEFNDRKVEAQRVVAGRTQLAQAIRDKAQQWIGKLRQKNYDNEIPSNWFTPYRVLTRTIDKSSELCAAAFVAIEAMQEDRGTFPRFKVHNKELDFPYSETASALNDDLREHRYWAQFCVPPPQTSSPISKTAAGKRKALTSSRPQPPDTASSENSTMSPPHYPSSTGTEHSDLLTRYQYSSEGPSEEALPSSFDAGQASSAWRSSRTSGHRLAPSRTSAPVPSMSSDPHQQAPITDAANALPRVQQPKKETQQVASSSSSTLGKSTARSYLGASAVVKSPTRGTPSGPPSMSSATLGQSGTPKLARNHWTFAPASHARMTRPPSNLHQPSYAAPSQEIRSQYRENMVPAKRRARESATDRRENPTRMTPTGGQQGAYPACETHVLVPSVDYIKSLAPEERKQIKSLRVLRPAVGEVIFTEPIDLSRDEILENVAGKLVRVMSSTTVTLLHGSIIGYPIDESWRHPLLSSFAFVCHKNAERLEVDMNDHLDALRGKLGAWEFELSPQSLSEMDSVQPGHHKDMPSKLTTDQQRRKLHGGAGGHECNAVSSWWHIVKHISLVYLRYAPGIAGNIDQQLVQIVGVTRYNEATKTRYLVAAAFETYSAVRFSAMKMECSDTAELWDMGVLESPRG